MTGRPKFTTGERRAGKLGLDGDEQFVAGAYIDTVRGAILKNPAQYPQTLEKLKAHLDPMDTEDLSAFLLASQEVLKKETAKVSGSQAAYARIRIVRLNAIIAYAEGLRVHAQHRFRPRPE